MKRPENLVVYHKNCNDGFGAAWVAWRFFRERKEEGNVEFLPQNYGEPIPEHGFFAGRKVWIVDFSYPRANLVEINGVALVLTVLDHHKTAQADLVGLDFCTFDMERSGAHLAWEHFFTGQPYPLLIGYLEDRDLWRWKLKNSKEVSAALLLEPKDFDRWDGFCAQLDSGTNEPNPVIVERGETALRYQGIIVADHVAKARSSVVALRHPGPGSIASATCRQVNATVLFSEIAGTLAEEDGADFGCCWFRREDGKYQYELRSRRDFDVSVVAKQFGGGGHKNAAGFESEMLLF